ncbi:Uncharacterised protein [Legionella wadsworthii]|uniref:Uncharacterized protein n=1 Tax=Legionella wadsworthii TaxID=28088 RepID=A0A378M193_9GAMM|nr:Uncharacterised protein [Legionella wadsworthii]
MIERDNLKKSDNYAIKQGEYDAKFQFKFI